jgi:hypothetical protein
LRGEVSERHAVAQQRALQAIESGHDLNDCSSRRSRLAPFRRIANREARF